MNNIQEQIEQARAEARAACETSGETSNECAVAWDNVEELQAEAAHKQGKQQKNSLEKYCDENPEADECRIYDE